MRPALDYAAARDEGDTAHLGFLSLLVAVVFGAVPLTMLFVGMVFLQDAIVDGVRDSHFLAWLYTAPWAGALSLTGTILSARVIWRRRPAWRWGVVVLLFNAVPLSVCVVSFVERRF
jgi:hypothetical protein